MFAGILLLVRRLGGVTVPDDITEPLLQPFCMDNVLVLVFRKFLIGY